MFPKATEESVSSVAEQREKKESALAFYLGEIQRKFTGKKL